MSLPLNRCLSDDIYNQVRERQPRSAIDVNTFLRIIPIESADHRKALKTEKENSPRLCKKKENPFLESILRFQFLIRVFVKGRFN